MRAVNTYYEPDIVSGSPSRIMYAADQPRHLFRLVDRRKSVTDDAVPFAKVAGGAPFVGPHRERVCGGHHQVIERKIINQRSSGRLGWRAVDPTESGAP